MSDTTLSSINFDVPSTYFASQDGQVISVANGDLGDADTSYFTFKLVQDGFNLFSLQFVIQATTLTFEATNDDVWTDLTTVLTGASTITSTGSLTITEAFQWKLFRVKRVTTNATNALDLYLTRGRA